MKNSENATIRKSNTLIEASYRLDLTEQRIVLFAMYKWGVDKTITSDTRITIRADEYAELFGVDPKSVYSQLKTAAETLYQRSVRLHDIRPETGKKRITDVRWVSEVSYVDGDGVIQFKFGSSIIPYLARLETNYTSYTMKSVAQMTSTYAIRLYELLIQWKKIGRREVELQAFKTMLGVGDEYAVLKNFKMRVLDTAVSQVNAFSDLDVRYENVKAGRKVIGFIFFFDPKPEKLEPKPKKAVSKVKSSVSGFAGLEFIMFNQLKKTYPDLKQADIHEMARKDGVEPILVLERMKTEIGNIEKFKLEKSL